MFESIISDQACIAPDSVAMRIGPNVAYTFGQMEEDVRRVTAWLRRQHIAPGSRVVVQLTNPYHHWLLMFGAEAIGLVPILASPLIVLTSDLLTYFEAASVLASSPKPDGVNLEWHHLDGRWGPTFRMISAEPLPARSRAANDLSLVLLSSGTTGLFKQVGFDRAMIDRRIRQFLSVLDDGTAGNAMVLLPFQSLGGFFYPMMVWSLGRTLTIPLSEPGITPLLVSGTITSILAAPSQLAEAIIDLDPTFARPTGLVVTTGGGPISPTLAREIHDRLTVDLRVAYGSTECGVLSYGPANDVDAIGQAPAPLVPDLALAVIGVDGDPVPVGNIGELCFRGDNIVAGYLGDPVQTARSFRHGWYHSGDLGRYVDGVLTVEGRVEDVIAIGGTRYMPAAFEHAVMALPGVRDAGAFGMQVNTRIGVDLCVAYVADQKLSTPDIEAAFATTKLPKMVRVEEIPRNSMGKIERSLLAKKAAILLG
jgi:acyl-CoA synthetase (AMP-forming)/AMP-acid ligase II